MFILCYATARRHPDGAVPAARLRPVAGRPGLLPGAGRVAGGLHRRALPRDRCAPRPAGTTWTWRSWPRCRGRARNWSPRRSGWAGCSWPATPRTCTRRPAGSAPTPASTTRTTWPGSWPRVLRGWAGEALLDTYDAERRPLGNAMAEQAMVRNRIRHGYADRAGPGGDGGRHHHHPRLPLPLRSSDRRRTEPGAPVLTPRLELTGEPGTRAPHVWLDRAGERMSTVDLFWDLVRPADR